jgi:hypothetical protein
MLFGGQNDTGTTTEEKKTNAAEFMREFMEEYAPEIFSSIFEGYSKPMFASLLKSCRVVRLTDVDEQLWDKGESADYFYFVL